MSRFVLAIVAMTLGVVLFTERIRIQDFVRELRAPDLPVSVEYKEVAVSPSKPADPTQTLPFARGENPKEVNLAVPFTAQAPSGDWKLPFKEACEEASVYMVTEFYAGRSKGQIEMKEATQAIEKIVAFEMETFGFYEDTTVKQTATLTELMYGYSESDIIENPTIEQIKQELALGHPVIVPLAGRELNNPFYTPPGPLYHMLVIRGYTKNDQFITNDPGTRRGEAFIYPFETIMNAIHDWDGSGDILKGKRIVLVLKPKK